MPTTADDRLIFLDGRTVHTNLPVADLVEHAVRRGEGHLAANGALNVHTGSRSGRSPGDKYLEDTPGIHGNIDWGKVNQPCTPEQFSTLESIVREYLGSCDDLYRFDGFAGADERYRCRVSVVAKEAWHALFASTLFIPSESADPSFAPDWTIFDAGALELSPEQAAAVGVSGKIAIFQSLERKMVLIVGTRYAGEIKKSIFYAMNHDLPDSGVFPMHCSCNVDREDAENVALFFGLSGTGKTTLSADPERALVGDDEHGWSADGVFNVEGGCYAKCIRLSEKGEPEIWNAIRFGSVLENVVLQPNRQPDYDDGSVTENTRVTYPIRFMDGALQPSVAGHPRHVIFLTADATGVLPPISRLTPEQAQYYFVNGYTSKLAGTEAGVTEPVPNFSPCFGGPFMPRPPVFYARMLADRIAEHGTKVWLLNTGWSGGGYGAGSRFPLAHTRAMVHAILDGSLDNVPCQTHPIFGLLTPEAVPGVPTELLDPRSTWSDPAAYDQAATALAEKFRTNDAKFTLDDAVRASGPTV